MEKKTQTWVLRYAVSSVHLTPRKLSVPTTDRATGKTITLLADGKVEHRAKLPNETEMPFFLFDQAFVDVVERDGKKVRKPFIQRSWELPKPGLTKEDFTPDEWATMQRDSGMVDYASKHIAVSMKNAAGVQLNKNFCVSDKHYFELFNADEIENDIADADLLAAQLLGEVGHVMQTDRVEFENICYGMQINPFNMGDGQLFSILKKIILSDLKAFDKFLHGDGEARWYKIVLNKALRFKKPGTDNTLIEKDEHDNYSTNGIVLSNGFEALVAYYKANPEMFDKLEQTLDMKKKEATNLTAEENGQKEPEYKKRGPKPRGESSGQ